MQYERLPFFSFCHAIGYSRDTCCAQKNTKTLSKENMEKTLLEKAKLEREISDGKNKIPHKFLGRKI